MVYLIKCACVCVTVPGDDTLKDADRFYFVCYHLEWGPYGNTLHFYYAKGLCVFSLFFSSSGLDGHFFLKICEGKVLCK